MTLPTPPLPTDNLYKLIAIAGLVLCVTGIVLPLQLQNDLQPDYEKLNRLAKEMTDVAVAESRALDAPDFDKAPTTNRGANTVPPPSTAASENFQTERDQRVAVEKKRAELLDSYNARLKSATRTTQLTTIAGILGFIAMIFGFVLWYRKVQRYQDQIILAQALKLQAELKKENATSKNDPV